MLPRPRSRRPLPLAFGFLLAVGTPPATRAASPAMTESGASAPSSSLATVSPAAPAPPVAPVRPHRFAEHAAQLQGLLLNEELKVAVQSAVTAIFA